MRSWVDIRYVNQTYALRSNFQELVLDINKFHDGFCNKQTLPHFQAIANSVELILNKCLNIPKVFNRQLFDEFSGNISSNLALIQTLGSHQNSFTLTETTSDKCNEFSKKVIEAYDYFMKLNKNLEAKKAVYDSPAKVIYDSPGKPVLDEIEIDTRLLSQGAIVKVIAQWRYIPLKNLKCTDKIAHLFYHYSKPMIPNTLAFYSLLDTGLRLLENEEQNSLNNLTSWVPPVVLFGVGTCLLLWQMRQENPGLPKQKDEKLISIIDVESPPSNNGESYKRLSASSNSVVREASPSSVVRALSFT